MKVSLVHDEIIVGQRKHVDFVRRVLGLAMPPLWSRLIM